MSDGPDSPYSQSSIEDDKLIWTPGSFSDADDTDFILLRHPFVDTHSLPSTLSDFGRYPCSDGDLSSVLDRLSLHDHDSLLDSSSASAVSDHNASESLPCTDKHRRASRNAKHRAQSSDSPLSSADYHSDIGTPMVSYDDASAFISRFISFPSPIKENDTELTLLRALIIEFGIRSPNASDLPSTLTSARKTLKAEAHVNIKEYVATRHKGQVALREILKPSKNALRRDLRKGNGASLRWVKQHGLQVLLVTCFK